MPASFHGYEVEEQIGAGGMSTVFRGIHKTLGYPVAIKILHPALSMDRHFIARFEREARAASNLASSNIARVIDYGEEAGAYFIIMEYVEGKDLGQLFRELQADGKQPKSFPVEISLLLLEDLAYALQKAHEQNIIHRDIKPSNVLLSKDGEIKLVDFGLARDVRLSPGELTHTGMVIGTPSYMSPEQAAGGRQLDGRSDTFSLGVMAYQFLTGEKPFKGETASAIQETIINGTPRPLTQDRCPLLTPEIDALVSRCLEKDPDKRFASMKKVVEAVESCLESIEEGGSLVRRRRALLSRFVADPRGVAVELHHRSIATHLKRGLHFKSLGREKLADAERELRRVLYLDPGNKKATEALAALEHQDETIIRPASELEILDGNSIDPTKIVDPEWRAPYSPPPPAGSTPPVKEAPRVSRGLVIAAALLVVALGAAAAFLFGDGRFGRGEPITDSTVVEVPDAIDTTSTEDTTSLAEVEQIKPPEPEPVAPAPVGYLSLELPERLDVYLNGQRVRTDVGPVTLQVEPDRMHQVEVRNRAAFGKVQVGSFTVAPGATRQLGPVRLAYGKLTLKANADITVRLDGSLLAESVQEIVGRRIGAGRHELSITAPAGYRIFKAIDRTTDGPGVPLVATGGDDRAPRYRIDIPLDGELILGFIVR